MKKSIKKSSRRKWVVGGVAFFGSIALLTTGFATWVVGVQQTDDEDNVNVTVDTTINEFVTFSLSLSTDDCSIKLGETKEPDAAPPEGKENIVKIDEVTGDLTVKIDSLNIEIGNDAVNSYTQIDFAITSANNTVSSQQFDENLRTGSSWSYLSAPASILLTNENENINKTTGANTTTYKLKSGSTISLDFKWGDFFGEQSPANFYNKNYRADKLGDSLSETINKINTEMDKMSSAFNVEEGGNNVLTLQATLTNGSVGA